MHHITSFFLRTVRLLTLCVAMLCAVSARAQNLIKDGDFNGSGLYWTTSCVSVEAWGFETTYGGADPTNHVAEIDDEACMHQDVCALDGVTYQYAQLASRRTGGGADDTIISHINIKGLDASGATVATYIDMDYMRDNTVFALTPVTGIPSFYVPPGAGVVTLRVTLTDNTPGYSTFGMIIDNVSLTFVASPPALTQSADTVCAGFPVSFGVTGVSGPGITYSWLFGSSSSPASSTAASPTVLWTAPGLKPISVILGNGTCDVDTLTSYVYVRAGIAVDRYDTTCSNVPVLFHGTWYNTTGIYTDTVATTSGCDSITFLHLYVKPFVTGAVSASICAGGSYTILGHTYSSAGTYNVDTFTAVSGCDSVVVLNLTVNPIPPPPVITDNPSIYCLGQPFVPFTVVSGTGVLWYTSAVGGVGSTISPVISTSSPGTDTVWASETVLGCESPRVPVVITVNGPIIAAFSYTIKYGCKADTVSFSNTSSGATAYRWYFGDGAISVDTSPVHIFYGEDTFYVKLIANNATCFDSTLSMLNLHFPLTGNFTADTNLICQGSSITFTDLSSGTGITHLWNFGDGYISNAVNPTHIYPHSGVYHVFEIVTDFVPCHDTVYKTISVDTISPIYISATDSVICMGTYVTFAGNYAALGNTGITWQLGNGDSILNVDPLKIAYDRPGHYNITAEAHYRVCPDTGASHSLTVMPTPLIYLGSDTSICKGGVPIKLGDNSNAASSGATWLWNTGQTTPFIEVVEPGTYSVTVRLNGCSSSSTIEIKNDCYINIPNVFTPNGDGMNDYFFPRSYLSMGLVSFRLQVFNRWGQIVFETSSLDGRGWDGTFNNVPQPEGVFVYLIDCTFKDGQKEHHQGNVTLLR